MRNTVLNIIASSCYPKVDHKANNVNSENFIGVITFSCYT